MENTSSLISSQNLINLLSQAPVAMAVYSGTNYVIELANKAMCDFWDKTQEEAIGKPLFELLPEAEAQGFRQVIDNVYKTGERFVVNEIAVELQHKGTKQTRYYNLLFEALRDEKGVINGIMGVANEVSAQVMARKKIEESEKKYRSLIESSDVATAIYEGPDMVIRLANEAMIRIWGKDESVIGKRLIDALPELEGQPFIGLLQNVYETGSTYKSAEQRADLIVNDVLQPFYFNFSYKALTDENGQVYAILNTAQDVSQMVSDRKRLTDVEETARMALKAGHYGIWDFDILNGNIYMDERCRELFGISENKVLTTEEMPEYIYVDDRPKIFEASERALDPQTKSDYRMEFRIVDTQGRMRWLRSQGKAFFQDAKACRFVGTSEDITHEKTLRGEQAKLLALVDNSVELMSLLGTDGRNSYINKAGRELLGFDSMQQVIETPIEALHLPEDFKRVNDEVLGSLMEKGRWSGRMNVRNLKTGDVFPVYNNTVRIDDPETGETLAFGAVMRDMRPELQVQHSLRESEGKYRQLNSELEDRIELRTQDLRMANTNLKRSNEDLEQFAYVASHDLQEPLRKIQMFSNLILSNLDDTEFMKKQVTKVNEASKRMATLVKELLGYSRLSVSGQEFENVNLNTIIALIITDLDIAIKEKNAVINCDPLPVITGLPLQLYQLFLNLLSNALKFSEQQPIVTITNALVKAGDPGTPEKLHEGIPYVYIRFSDNGIGFDQAYAEKVFTIFQRLNPKQDYPGTGIGLAICKKVVENHSGLIDVNSAPGRGTTFHIYLPVSA